MARHLDDNDLKDLARDLPVPPLSADRREAVRNEVLSKVTTRRSRRRWRWQYAAAAAVVLGVGVGMMVRGETEAPVVTGTPDLPIRAEVHGHEGSSLMHLGDELVRLVDGTVTVQVERLVEGQRFRVVTGDGEVEVRGTTFDVRADRDQLQSVRVLHGRVVVRLDGTQVADLREGERWHRPEASDRHTVRASAEQLDIDSAPPGPSAEQRASTEPGPHPYREHPSGAPAEASPATDTPLDAAEESFQEAWRALREGRPGEAARAFDRVLEAEDNETLAADAAYWKAVALSRTGEQRRAVIAFEVFLERHPRSPRVLRASGMLGWMLLDEGRLREAERRFADAAGSSDSRVKTSAEQGLEEVARRRSALPVKGD